MANNKEIVTIAAEDTKVISWTTERKARFGKFPEVEVYVQDEDGVYYKSPVQPVIIGVPPAPLVSLTFEFSGPVNGFIMIM